MTKRLDSRAETPKATLTRLRKICLGLPGVTDVTAWGHPNFKASNKTFAVLERYEGEWAIAVKTDPEHQQLLIESDARFYVTPHVGKQGWVSLRIAGRVDWKEVEALVRGSYRALASKALLAELDARPQPRRRG